MVNDKLYEKFLVREKDLPKAIAKIQQCGGCVGELRQATDAE
jgi:hypothetical protein